MNQYQITLLNVYCYDNITFCTSKQPISQSKCYFFRSLKIFLASTLLLKRKPLTVASAVLGRKKVINRYNFSTEIFWKHPKSVCLQQRKHHHPHHQRRHSILSPNLQNSIQRNSSLFCHHSDFNSHSCEHGYCNSRHISKTTKATQKWCNGRDISNGRDSKIYQLISPSH